MDNNSAYDEAWCIYEFSVMMDGRESPELMSLAEIAEDVREVIVLAYNQLDNVLSEEDKEDIRDNKRTIKDCEKWLSKYLQPLKI